MDEAFDVWEIHPEVFSEHGDAVLVLGHMHLRGREAGSSSIRRRAGSSTLGTGSCGASRPSSATPMRARPLE